MISRWGRTWIPRAYRPVLFGLARLGITPDGLTLLGLAAAIGAGLLFALQLPVWAAAVFLLANGFDSLDGELARFTGNGTVFGEFLDSICDHLGDFAVYFGILWAALARQDHLQPLLILAALFGSVFGSHVRSRAGMIGIPTRTVGIATRLERSVVLTLSVFLGQLTIGLAMVALLTNFSALQRIIYTARDAGKKL